MKNKFKSVTWLLILSFIIYIINIFLIYPYFYQSQPGWVESIEVSFISMGKFYAQNFPHIWWNPYWYSGFPMRYSYAPIIPLATAILGQLIGNFGRAYHLITGISYCLVPVSVFLLLKFLTKSKTISFFGALFFTLMPSVGTIFEGIRQAQAIFGQVAAPPWRIMVTFFYGEGPHTLSMIFIPLSGLFFVKALEERKYSNIILSSVFVALSGLANPIGLWANGLFMGSIFITYIIWNGISKKVFRPTFLIALISYLFISFWYTPGFISSDFLAESGGLVSGLFKYFPWGFLAVLFFFITIFIILKRFIKTPREAFPFVWFSLLMLVIAVYYKTGIELAPQARRYIPELDIAFILCLGYLVKWFSEYIKNKYSRFPTFIIPLVLSILVLLYTNHVWKSTNWFTSATNESNSYFAERDVIGWLSKNVRETERAFVSSNYTFWLDFKTNIWQLRGGHWQASTHPWEPHAGYQITAGPDAETSLNWLKTFAMSWIVVSKAGSPVSYADYAYPDKFDNLLTEVYPVALKSEFAYKVPLKYGMAGSVNLSSLLAAKPPINGADNEALKNYVNTLEASSSQLNFTRINNDHYKIFGTVGSGEAVRIAFSFDKGFTAKDSTGKKLKIVKDPLSFLVIKPASSGPVKIDLYYGPTLDFYLGILVFASGIFAVFAIRKNYYSDEKTV